MPSNKEKTELATRKQALLEKTAAFCRAHLDDEYQGLCVRLIEKMARKREVPFKRGDLNIWAAAIIHVLGRINFLFDASFEPHIKVPQIAEFFGVSQSTVSQKSSSIRNLMKLSHFITEFLGEKMMAQQAELQNMMLEMTSAMFGPEELLDAPYLSD